MKILVTGGAGALGSQLNIVLQSRGHDVITCDLAHAENEIGISLHTDVLNPSYIKCNVAEYRQLERVFHTFGPFDYVYHLAAEYGRWDGEDFYEQVWNYNAVGTKNVIRLQEKLGFRLIFFSSSEVYGDFDGVMSEDVTDKFEIKQQNDYGLSKWVGECQIRNSVEQYGTETVIIRPTNTYGPGEYYSPYRSVNCRFKYCALKGIPWTVFRGHSRTSTYVEDTVRTVANVVDNFIPGEVYNISSDQHHTIEELSDLILKLTGADPNLVTYKDSEILTTKHKRVDNSKSIKDLGHFDSVTLEEGVKKTIDWMREIYC